MKLYTQKGELMLPDGFTFDIQVTNPLFSNDGAASVATTLPATNENCKILGRPERLTRSARPARKFPAVLRHGVFQKKCSMIIAGCSRTEGIETSLAFHESELYAEFKGKNMKDVFETIRVSDTDFSLTSLDACMSDLYSKCYKNRTNNENLVIFPVAVEKDDGGVKFLNETTDEGFVYARRSITQGGISVSVPAGYGVTPFLWLHRAVRLLFELSGYEVVRNDFEEAPFSLIVLVNNCSDTFCKGPKITFRDLVPSVKTEEFILWLYDKFGAFVAVDGKSVRIMMQQKILSATYDLNLSGYVRGTPSITYPTSSRVVLSCDTSLDSASPPAESLLQFRIKHSVVREKAIGEDAEANGVVFRKQIGKYFMVKNYPGDSEQFLGSNCFRYDRDNSEDTEQYAASDRFLPEILEANELMPYIGDRLHYNTSIANEPEEGDQPIQVCYAARHAGSWFGTTQHYAVSGEQVGHSDYFPLPDLTPEGLYPVCWAAYNDILLNAAPEIRAQIDYPPGLLLSMDVCTPKFIGGVKVMIKSFSYQVSSTGIKCGESVLQVLPAYKDQISDTAIEFSEGVFVWVVENTMLEELDKLVYGRNDYNILEYDNKGDYTLDDAPAYSPAAAGIVAKKRGRWVNVEIVILGIGEDQVVGQQQVSYEEYFISVRDDSQ